MLVKPVLPAYRHFELVQALTDERPECPALSDHECFILGGWRNLAIPSGRCHISFVREKRRYAAQTRSPPRLFFERRNSQQRNSRRVHFPLRGIMRMAVCTTGNVAVRSRPCDAK